AATASRSTPASSASACTVSRSWSPSYPPARPSPRFCVCSSSAAARRSPSSRADQTRLGAQRIMSAGRRQLAFAVGAVALAHALAVGAGAAVASKPAPAPRTASETTTTPTPPTRPAAPQPPARVVLSNERTVTVWAHPVEEVGIRARPLASSRTIARTRVATEDGYPEVYLLLSTVTDAHGREWVQMRIPGRPNGRIGWVSQEALGEFQVS